MANKEEYVPVTFLNSLGEEISNDPVWRARKTLEAAGQGGNGASFEAGPSQGGGSSRPADHEEYLTTRYDDVNSKDLQKIAKDTEGFTFEGKTVGELRQALEAFALAQEADEAADDDADDEDDE